MYVPACIFQHFLTNTSLFDVCVPIVVKNASFLQLHVSTGFDFAHRAHQSFHLGSKGTGEFQGHQLVGEIEYDLPLLASIKNVLFDARCLNIIYKILSDSPPGIYFIELNMLLGRASSHNNMFRHS